MDNQYHNGDTKIYLRGLMTCQSPQSMLTQAYGSPLLNKLNNSSSLAPM